MFLLAEFYIFNFYGDEHMSYNNHVNLHLSFVQMSILVWQDKEGLKLKAWPVSLIEDFTVSSVLPTITQHAPTPP